ncbi:hypothetical protein PSN45_001982 [Yamadazyma tenuis]|uniref:Zn(2)-C6 fungal-type domain-containing protein n=1 Tax=Candida tenuis (strain ATCC 10573 / BCRC 21748 / CBS 615 / JCM 9827 / NBRC 10315 / NRRL Y-1498 / VKM Y-70) TaxID=590646 RepID=G3BD81_CANTC|nr:uncharacterized protein CANTEDRAFT_136749 [Yamadazyma tenuis ATCC 10573]EGV60262.1 hypothetical protein CANTEDRAFT_136749 [Yamadazyma tenuis ATCC 10573]WEJ94496.1 hypothetical protein PSN45_001982 [Yamadazyma tenuis]
MTKRSDSDSDTNSNDNTQSKKQKVKLDKDSSNFKLITTSTGPRVSQACDRCRIKKIKCDGLRPCQNCSKINFDCKTSDKLTRRAFPKGYTENLENKVKLLEEENRKLKLRVGDADDEQSHSQTPVSINPNEYNDMGNSRKQVIISKNNARVQINNPIDQIFNLDKKGIIIGNDNLNFESQFNHLLINLNLPFLKITNSHNYLLDDPNSYLYHPSSALYNSFHNRDLDVIYNPLTSSNKTHDSYLGAVSNLTNNELPIDIYDLFIKLINSFKKIFSNKKELDNQITSFFLNYNIFIPIFDYKKFMESYDNFHTMYPFMFTYDDATINGFNLSNNDYSVVNEYLMVVIQIYAIIMMNNPTINLNLLLNHSSPYYALNSRSSSKNKNIIRSLYDFLPYLNVFHVSISQLQTCLLFLYYSLLTNNKEKSLVLSSLINAFIGVLGINLNSKNLFFNDLSLDIQQRRDRVKIFWVFKVLLKCFNLKFGFKPSLNTTVINPVTIDRYFQLTPEKLSSLLESEIAPTEDDDEHVDELFKTLLKPSIEFLNLVNIIIPSSFSPNYYQYLKGSNHSNKKSQQHHPKNLDWILNDDDGDGNDGNLNYNFNQFVTIDNNLAAWRESLKTKTLNLVPLEYKMNLSKISYDYGDTSLYHSIKINNLTDLANTGITEEEMNYYLENGLPDISTTVKMIQIQLNFHYLVIRSSNYLNFIVDKELSAHYYSKIVEISKELLGYFVVIFSHVTQAVDGASDPALTVSKSFIHHNPHSTGTNPVILDSLGIDVDEDGFVINDFSAKRRRTSNQAPSFSFKSKTLPSSPFNFMLNGLSMTVINLKKTILLQMLYILICSIKSIKKNNQIDSSLNDLVNVSVDVFIKVFVNYQLNSKKKNSTGISKLKEDELYNKLMNDELKDQILREQRIEEEENEEDYVDYQLEFENTDYFSGFNQISEIDWDDEEMDEDLKILKILKFIKYKMNQIKELAKRRQKLKHKLHTPVDETPKTTKATVKPEPTVQFSPPPSIHNFYTSSNPPKYPPNLPKIPSISKLDYLLPEDNFPTHTIAGNFTKSKDYVIAPSKRDDDLVKREQLAVNDLMSLKNGHGSPTGLESYRKSGASTNTSPH